MSQLCSIEPPINPAAFQDVCAREPVAYTYFRIRWEHDAWIEFWEGLDYGRFTPKSGVSYIFNGAPKMIQIGFLP